MARQLRKHQEPEQAMAAIKEAIASLKHARAKLRFAGASKSAVKVVSAIKSAEGAERHAQRLGLEG